MDDLSEKKQVVDSKKGERRSANSIVPFPHNIPDLPSGTLDNYVGNFDKVEDLPSYDTLPDWITSNKLEVYINWLAELTKADPEHRERGAFVHYGLKNSKPVFPVNPSLGSKDAVVPDISLGKKFFSLARVHSHPNATCFSPQDLKRPISGRESVMDMVATQDLNFLLLRSSETELVDSTEAKEIMEDIEKETHEKAGIVIRGIYELVESRKMEREFADYTNGRIYQLDLERYGEAFEYYWLTLLTTWHVAEEFKLGFYWSAKDGQYNKMTKETLEKIKIEAMKIRKDFFDSLAKSG